MYPAGTLNMLFSTIVPMASFGRASRSPGDGLRERIDVGAIRIAVNPDIQEPHPEASVLRSGPTPAT
jgi:hypothetical protein